MPGKRLSKSGRDGRRFNGGPGRGGGRKPGQATIRNRDIANRILSGGEPLALDVMYENMLFWHRQSMSIGDKVSRLLDIVSTPEQRDEVMKLMRMFLNCREQAQKCAVDCAPYLHARLSSIELRAPKQDAIEEVKKSMTPQQAAEAYASTLRP